MKRRAKTVSIHSYIKGFFLRKRELFVAGVSGFACAVLWTCVCMYVHVHHKKVYNYRGTVKGLNFRISFK